MNYVDADDGTFWMSFSDYQSCFDRFSICKYRDDYEFNNIKIEADEQEDGYKLIGMTIPSGEGEYTISLSQKDNRFYPKDN